MKIAIYYSGCIRTLKYVVKDNIETIRKNIGDCDIHTYYSFWDETDKPVDTPDEWCVPVSGEFGDDRFKDVEGNKSHDGLWLDYTSHNKFHTIESEDEIKKWFIDAGSSFVEGEIESIDISRNIIQNSLFIKIPKVASQYYKIYRVAEKYPSDEYDLCVRIRGDVRIKNFPSRNDIDLESSLFINSHLWPNGDSSLQMCNEMVWCSTSDIFLDTCSAHLYHGDTIQYDPSGETVTARHFTNLINNDIVKNYCFFDFQHNAMRFAKRD